MYIFRAIRELDYKGNEWSPKVSITCPHCTAKLSYYTQLLNNICVYCFKGMPFPSGMVKSDKLRVEFHVNSKTEGQQ